MVFLAVLASVVTIVLSIINVLRTFKTLHMNYSPQVRLHELQFWSVYMAGVVLTWLLAWVRGDSTPVLQLFVCVALVVVKYLDSDHAIISSVYGVAEQGAQFLDVHFVTPNSEKFLLRPCAQLMQFGLQTIRESRSLSPIDRARAAECLSHSNEEILAELARRKQETAPTGAAAATAGADESPLSVPPPASALSFASLRRYFLLVNALMSDDDIARVLTTYDGRDAELRRKLEKKYSRSLDDIAELPEEDAAAPRLVSDLDDAGLGDNQLRRRKH